MSKSDASKHLPWYECPPARQAPPAGVVKSLSGAMCRRCAGVPRLTYLPVETWLRELYTNQEMRRKKGHIGSEGGVSDT